MGFANALIAIDDGEGNLSLVAGTWGEGDNLKLAADEELCDCKCGEEVGCVSSDDWLTAEFPTFALEKLEPPYPGSPYPEAAPDPPIGEEHGAVWYYGADDQRTWVWSEPDEECPGGIRYYHHDIEGGNFEEEGDPWVDQWSTRDECCKPPGPDGVIKAWNTFEATV